MDEPWPDGGMIRKLWIGETDAYRDHLLRLHRTHEVFPPHNARPRPQIFVAGGLAMLPVILF